MDFRNRAGNRYLSSSVNGSSGIRNKEAMLVVDRNHSPPLHDALPTVMADPEVPGSCSRDVAAL